MVLVNSALSIMDTIIYVTKTRNELYSSTHTEKHLLVIPVSVKFSNTETDNLHVINKLAVSNCSITVFIMQWLFYWSISLKHTLVHHWQLLHKCLYLLSYKNAQCYLKPIYSELNSKFCSHGIYDEDNWHKGIIINRYQNS